MDSIKITVIGCELFVSKKGNEIKRIHWLEKIDKNGEGYVPYSCYVDLKLYNELIKSMGDAVNAYVLHRGPYHEILGVEEKKIK